jgi:hypothetical protein
MPKRANNQTTYRVCWEIDVEATNALDAAWKARFLQVGPRTTARVFDAWPLEARSKANRIDLCSQCEPTIEPSDVVLAIIERFPGLIDDATNVAGADLVECLTHQLRQLTDVAAFVAEARLAATQ